MDKTFTFEGGNNEGLVIKCKLHEPLCMPEQHGDFIDLKSAEDVVISGPRLNVHNNKIEFQTGVISLGVSFELPKGYYAMLVPRSSTFKNFSITFPNSIGIIDNDYNGDNDIWKVIYKGEGDCVIKKGDRIAQFGIFKSHGGVGIEYVESLGNDDRGGIGSTGKR